MSPPPSYFPRQSNRDLDSSSYRNESSQQISYENSETTQILSDESASTVSKFSPRYNNLNLVKSILGPSFEDTVLRTLEFGKSLMKKPPSEANDSEREKNNPRRRQDSILKRRRFGTGDAKRSNYRKEVKAHPKEQRQNKKRLVYSMKTENDSASDNKQLDIIRPSYVSKIRSLDSELKGLTPSPEEIKKELEALCQINKDEPPECPNNWGMIAAKELQKFEEFRKFESPMSYALMPKNISCMPDNKAFRGNSCMGITRCETVLPCCCTTNKRPETSRCPRDDISRCPPRDNVSRFPPRDDDSRCPPPCPPREDTSRCSAREDLSRCPPSRESARSSRQSTKNPCSNLGTISENKRREATETAVKRREPTETVSKRRESREIAEAPSKRRESRETTELVRSVRNEEEPCNPLCQAPEVISNALGPTLDVSIIDNLKMMRELFKSGDDNNNNNSNAAPTETREEPAQAEPEPQEQIQPQPQMQVQIQPQGQVRELEQVQKPPPTKEKRRNSKKCDVEKLEELKGCLEELLERKREICRQIEEEEEERCAKRKAFEDEQKKWQSGKCCTCDNDGERKVRCKKSSTSQCTDVKDCEKKLDCLRQAVECEEEKLNYLREEHECLMKEICEAQEMKNEALKKNKSLLDAWDVIASKPCHTRLPSFSRAHCLERKTLKECPSTCKSRCSSVSSCKTNRSKSCESKKNCCRKSVQSQNEITKFEFPLQRDITCGLHTIVKTCCCKSPIPAEALIWTSEDDLIRLSCPSFKSKKDKLKNKLRSIKSKSCSRSKSETGVCCKKEKTAKVCKVMWAVARINIFEDNTRTYEILDATNKAPDKSPCKTEGIFVVKNAHNKKCSSSLVRKSDCI